MERRRQQRSQAARALRQGRRQALLVPRGPGLQLGRPEQAPSFRGAWSALGGGGMSALVAYAGLALLVVLVAAVILIDRAFAGQIIPNVTIHGQPVGGLTPGEAGAALRLRYADWLRQPVALTYLGEQHLPSLDELGVRVDVERTVGDAFNLGRAANPILGIREFYTAWRYGLEMPLYISVDEARLKRYLLRLAEQTDRPPRDADLRVEQAAVRVTPAIVGRQLLIDQSAADILRAVERLQPASVALHSRELPPAITDAEVAPVAERVGTLLSGPLALALGDRTWAWETEQLADLLILRRDGGQVSASIDRELLYRRVEPIALEVTREPKEPRLRFENGALQIVEPGHDGATLDREGSVTRLLEALWLPERSVALAGEVTRPQVRPENLASLGINELIAEGRSAFPGSANYRITNIVNGARLIDGTLVPPGGQFEFNSLVEPVDERNGFVQGLAIVDNRTQQEWGGGLCQVSTTVFRAAFWGGFPIDERHEHGFRIGWYEIYEPIGMDAAIFTGPYGDNLRFTNDTGHWILIQTEVVPSDVTMYVRIYGSKPDRQVLQGQPVITRRLPAPGRPVYVNDPALPAGVLRRTDIAQEGLELYITRTVVQGGQVLREDTFTTTFKPWPNIYVRGTGR
jgi:vancomycin resistance protein YoaR